jgi:RNA polymerase-binding transcription factor DksA
MATAEQAYLRTELIQRRLRLHAALHSPAADASLSQLLTAVDTALSRIDQGTFGLCEECHDTVSSRILWCASASTITSAERQPWSDLSWPRIQRGLLPKLV